MKQLFRDAARLRAARVPGKGRPGGLDEAIAVVREQAETLEWWIKNGLSLGEIRAWVEGREVMGALPKSPAKLKTFTFALPWRAFEVLQITTRVGDKLVVLYTLPLRDVPAEGLKLTLSWLNGQAILLNITRDENGELSVEVVINPHRSVEPVVEDRARRRAGYGAPAAVEPTHEETPKPKAKAAGAGSIFVRGGRLLADLLFPPVPKLGHTAAALSFILVLIPLSNLGAGEFATEPSRRQETLARRVDPSEVQAADTTADSSAQPIAALTSSDDTASVSPASALGDAPAPTGKRKGSKGAETPKPAPAPETASGVGAGGRVLKTNYGQRAGAGLPAENAAGNTPAARALASAAEQYNKLAALRSIYVKLDRKQPSLLTESDKLHDAFVRALKASNRFVVLGETDQRSADAVISLRFWESDADRQAAIYANARDLNGNILWDELVNCSDLQDGSQPAALEDASVRLVNKLKEVVGYAQQSSKYTE